MSKQYSAGAVRKEILGAIRTIPGMPHINYPQTPQNLRKFVLPYADFKYLTAPVVQQFVGIQLKKQQLCQIDLYISKKEDMTTMDDYEACIEKHLHNYKCFGLTRVSAPPEVIFRGETDKAFRVTVNFTMEYFVNFTKADKST